MKEQRVRIYDEFHVGGTTTLDEIEQMSRDRLVALGVPADQATAADIEVRTSAWLGDNRVVDRIVEVRVEVA